MAWTEGDLDPVRCGGHLLVLPDADHPPPVHGQAFVGVPVPRGVSRQLVPPPPTVAVRDPTVLGTRVPKAAIDEDRHPRRWEHQVGTSTNPAQRRSVDEEPPPPAVQLPAQGQLGCGVPAALVPHPHPRPLTGRCARGHLLDGGPKGKRIQAHQDQSAGPCFAASRRSRSKSQQRSFSRLGRCLGHPARSRTRPRSGLTGVALVTSDSHSGLVQAIGATLPGAS